MLTDFVKKHIKTRLFEDGNIKNQDPYTYSIIDNVFPVEYYQEILKNLPEDSDYFHAVKGEQRGRIWLGHNPSMIKCECSYCKSYANKYQIKENDFWEDLIGYLISDKMITQWIKKYENELRELHGESFDQMIMDGDFNMRGFLVRDYQGYQIQPHTDQRNKSLTIIFYLADSNTAKECGTTICKPKPQYRGWKHFSQFEMLKTIEYIPNQAYVFVVTPDSWHCVQPIKDKISRNSIQINIEHSKYIG